MPVKVKYLGQEIKEDYDGEQGAIEGTGKPIVEGKPDLEIGKRTIKKGKGDGTELQKEEELGDGPLF